MTDRTVDVVVCGAGPVGAAFALLLRERGMPADRIAIVDARARDAATLDDRMVAISHGSALLLARLGAWRDGVERIATAITRVHISHRGRFGRTLIDRDDYDVPALGYVIRLGDLGAVLDGVLVARGITVERPVQVRSTTLEGDHLRAATDGDGDYLARHVVHAEGGLFDAQAGRAIRRAYGQTAVTSFVTLREPPTPTLAHTAYERFTEAGPIALLPARMQALDGYSLVWCGEPAEAETRLALDDARFIAALQAAFGDRLGAFATATPRRAFPLGLNAHASTARALSSRNAEFAIGNAAQTLHPVAGQGLNLGLRDAFVLATTLDHQDPTDHRPMDAHALVARYEAARRSDRRVTIELTDFMPRVFARSFAPLAVGRGLTLALLDVAAPLRGVFARQMMDGRR